MLRKYFIDSLLSSVPRVRGRKRIIFCIGDDSALEEDLLEALQESKFDVKWQTDASPILFNAIRMNSSVAICCTERESMDSFVLSFYDVDSFFLVKRKREKSLVDLSMGFLLELGGVSNMSILQYYFIKFIKAMSRRRCFLCTI